MHALTIYRATGKDVFGCKAQLKADGFQYNEQSRGWYGSAAAVEKFKARVKAKGWREPGGDWVLSEVVVTKLADGTRCEHVYVRNRDLANRVYSFADLGAVTWEIERD